MVDFGDDRLTAGRPHPMIDPTLRLERLAREAADPAVGVVLLDVVLGHGADPDPGASLAPPSGRRGDRGGRRPRPRGRRVAVRHRRRPAGPRAAGGALRDAGASVLLSNAAAARLAVSLLEGRDACPACSPPSRRSSPPAPRCSPTP
jgi:FdrA protein